MSIRSCVKALVPPLLWRVIRAASHYLERRPEWEYAPKGWCTKDPNIKGWNVASVVETEKAKWPEFVRAVEGAGPLAVAHEAPSISNQNLNAHNILMSYGYVLAMAARNRSSLSILDWGCGLGHYYVISKALLPDLALDYYGKDLPMMCSAAREAVPEGTFFDDEAVCFRREYDLVMASTSLQYSENWKQTLRKLAGTTRQYMYVTNIPIIDRQDSFVVVQRPCRYGYKTEYLSWFLNRDEFLRHAESLGMILVREFFVEPRPYVHRAPEHGEYRGFLFRPGKSNTGSTSSSAS